MAATERLSRFKSGWQRLRSDSLDAAARTHRIVSRGIRNLAEHELQALDGHFQSMLASVRSPRAEGSVHDIAQQQLDLMQQTVNRVIVNARESLAIVAATRMELVNLMKKSVKGGKAAKPTSKLAKLKASGKTAAAKAKASVKKARGTVKKVTKKAKAATRKPIAKAKSAVKKPIAKAKAAAKKPLAKATSAVQKPVAKAKAAVQKAQTAAHKTASQARQTVATAQRTATARASAIAQPMLAAVAPVIPSPMSRAFLATTKGKKEAADAGVVPAAPATAAVAEAPEEKFQQADG